MMSISNESTAWLDHLFDQAKAEVTTPATSVALVKDSEPDAGYFRKLEHYGVHLNEPQLSAVRHTEDPMQIIAAAGSEKSACIAAKIGYLIQVKAAPPHRILAITFTRKAARELSDRVTAILDHKSNFTNSYTFHSLFLRLLKAHGYNRHRILADDAKEVIINALDDLEASTKEYLSIPSFVSYVDELILQYNKLKEYNQDKASDAISLMSIHSAKGLEFAAVYLIGCSEGIIPHAKATAIDSDLALYQSPQEAIEEERRLLYVAITRAKQRLYISSPQIYNKKRVEVSSFLLETFSV